MLATTQPLRKGSVQICGKFLFDMKRIAGLRLAVLLVCLKVGVGGYSCIQKIILKDFRRVVLN